MYYFSKLSWITLAKKMALIKWMLASSCDRQDSQRKWRKNGCRSRSARIFWSVYTFFLATLYVYKFIITCLLTKTLHSLLQRPIAYHHPAEPYDDSTTNPPRKHVSAWACYNEKCVGEIYAQCNKSGPIAPLLTPVIQSANASVRNRYMNNTNDYFREISNKYRCFKCVHFLRNTGTKDEIISAINKNK
jgi:hypothetical protein